MTKHHRHSFRLERWHRRSVYVTGLALLLTGLAWLVLRYFMRPVGEFGETVNPLEPWAMKLHGLAAMAALFFVGSMLHLHIRRAVKAGRNLVTGWSMVGTLAFLVVTGYGLYYLAGDADRPVWSALHWVVGIAVAVLFVLHIVVGRKSVR
jgi:cytochrome b561